MPSELKGVGTSSRHSILAALLLLASTQVGAELSGVGTRLGQGPTTHLPPLRAHVPPRLHTNKNLRGGGPLLSNPKQEDGPPAPSPPAAPPMQRLQHLLLLRLSALCCCAQGVTSIVISEQIEKVVLGGVSRGALTELWGIISLGWGVGQFAAADRLPPQRFMLLNAAPALFALWTWVRSALHKDMVLSWSETSKRSNAAEIALVTWLKKVSAVQFALFLASYAYYFVLDPAADGLEACQY